MVGVARIELATPAMSTQCSTTELHAHTEGPLRSDFGQGKALQAAVLVLGLEHPVDFGHQVLEVEWLGQQFGLGRGPSALQRDRGEAGDKHHLDRGVDRARFLRQLDPVHLGHDDVSQKQIVAPGLEQRDRLGTATDRVDIIADAGQRALQIFAHRRIVFGQEDPDHGEHNDDNARLLPVAPSSQILLSFSGTDRLGP